MTADFTFWDYARDSQSSLDWKQFNRALLNATPNGVALFNRSLETILSNKTIQKRLAIFPGARLAATCPDLTHPAQKVMATLEPIPQVILKKNDLTFTVSLNPMISSDEPVGILAIFQDMTDFEKITDRMKSFKELSMELDTIIDSSNDGLWICDGNGKVLRINKASEKLTRVKASEMIGKHMRYLVDEKIIDQSVTLEVLKTRKKISIIQKTREGRKLFLTGNPVFNRDGSLFRVVVNERDITEIMDLQTQLKEKAQLSARYQRDLLEKQIEEAESRQIIAKSPEYRNLIQKAIKLGEVDSSVLILGESGTGKGVIADLIHKYSTRSGHPMIKLNCGAIPDSLVESELFGYEKGAFTGAHKQGKAGKFEMADNGIIFLDEIAELPLSSQVKLLKFLEDGVITRVGSTENKKVNVRIIAATNRNLKRMIEEKRFRSDLYYRLNVIPLRIPLLRERTECLLPLIHHYIDFFSQKYGKDNISLSSDVVDALITYPYPGNVREMINICERLVVMSRDLRVTIADLPSSVRAKAGPAPLDLDTWQAGQTLPQMVEDLEKKVLEAVFKKHKTQARTAKELGLNQSTVARKLKKYDLI